MEYLHIDLAQKPEDAIPQEIIPTEEKREEELFPEQLPSQPKLFNFAWNGDPVKEIRND